MHVYEELKWAFVILGLNLYKRGVHRLDLNWNGLLWRHNDDLAGSCHDRIKLHLSELKLLVESLQLLFQSLTVRVT